MFAFGLARLLVLRNRVRFLTLSCGCWSYEILTDSNTVAILAQAILAQALRVGRPGLAYSIDSQEAAMRHLFRLSRGLLDPAAKLVTRVCPDDVILRYGYHSNKYHRKGGDQFSFFCILNDYTRSPISFWKQVTQHVTGILLLPHMLLPLTRLFIHLRKRDAMMPVWHRQILNRVESCHR